MYVIWNFGNGSAGDGFNIVTMQNEFNDYDNSFMILLFSVISFVVWFTFLVIWLKNEVTVYRLQKKHRQENISIRL